jgi:Flp pilus assembly protein TadG
VSANRTPDASKARGARGTVLIEFGLVLPFLLVVTLTVVDLTRAYWLKSMVNDASRQGARVAAVQDQASIGAGLDSVLARVNKVLEPTGINDPASSHVTLDSVVVTPLDFDPDAAGVSNTTDHYRVKVAIHFDWLYLGLLNLFGPSVSNPQTLTASAVMRKE